MRLIKATAALLALAHRGLAACIDVLDAVEPSPQTPMIAAKTIKPSIVSQNAAGSVIYNVTFAEIRIYNGQPKYTITTLLTFNFPNDAKAKQCTFGLSLDSSAKVCPAGYAPPGAICSGQFALYSSFGTAQPNKPPPARNNWIGVLQAKSAGTATWLQPSTSPVNIVCPTGEVGFELVQTGDYDYVGFGLGIGPQNIVGFTY